MKFVEPAIEGMPLVRSIACSVYVMVGVRN